jgi:ubiquinone/menaquinone biosynthesis C-methylase UbiE
LEKFTDKAADYAKYRPSYPSTAFDCILKGLNQPTVADIGAGTGISSRALADNQLRVIAIEPNLAMRKAAQPHPLVEFHNGKSDETKLQSNSVDLVTCFDSFYWFHPPENSLREFNRILKPAGRLAVIFNKGNKDEPFTKRYNQLTGFYDVTATKTVNDVEKSLWVTSYFTNVRSYIFPYQQVLEPSEQLLGLARSYSGFPKTGAVVEQLLVELQQLYSDWVDDQGLVYLVYHTHVYLLDVK